MVFAVYLNVLDLCTHFSPGGTQRPDKWQSTAYVMMMRNEAYGMGNDGKRIHTYFILNNLIRPPYLFVYIEM